MSEAMTRIELGGEPGKIFGKTHWRLISKVSEAGVALAKTITGFESYMVNSKRRGLTFAIFKGKKNIGVDDLGYPVTGDVIRIVPVIIGSKKAGLLQTILGAVLVAVGAVLNFTPWAAASPFLYKFGAAMMIGGVVQMLSPQPAGLASKQS
ncbi:TPA: tail assembly protein, partial [Escherichia coli]|nr:tail assembly protein [Escherichia coli]